ncbi:MAG: hypothetical protein KDD73_09915 [Anaerolineales bacterium]|nr:hypothetical protein [Anaerolineales bacterium]MCB9126675.1 endonuclease [Ardenticatenales bacterium]MCB9171785.1 endonuclease [Ardenticatenales bacterium]
MDDRYARIIEHIFLSNYESGDSVVPFERTDLVAAAVELGVEAPKNLGDILYAFRSRRALPAAITETEPEDQSWVIAGRGRSRYAFVLKTQSRIHPDPMLAQVKIPDATPGVVARYVLSDEQALLTKVRYNRLIDLFTGVTCYSIQNHLRTTVKGIGQVETDELYVGIDKYGAHYVFPVQAKGNNDEIGVIQIEQDMALCKEKFPDLICYAIAAQFMADEGIALFMLALEEGDLVKLAERHYQLVPLDEVSQSELERYRQRRNQGRLRGD